MKKLNIILLGIILAGCGESYIAKVNGDGISEQQFDAFIEHKRIALAGEEQKEKVLDQYLQREALANLIEQKLLKNPALVEAEIHEMKKEILISRYFDNFLADAVSDEAVLNYYNSNSAKYEEKKVHVAHVLLRLNRNMDDSQRKVKLTTIQEAYSKLQAGMPFEEVVKTYSEDDISAKKQGDIGWIKEGAIHKTFSDAAFSVAEGEYSKIIETPYGYHIVKVLDAPQVNRKSFDAVKGQIRYELRNLAKAAERERLLKLIKIEKS